MSIYWRPPVTLIVAKNGFTPCKTRTELIAEFGSFPFEAGLYHVWRGELVNIENWKNKFGEL